MKNHRKAREFCERGVYMEEGAKERLLGKVKDEIYTANSSNTSLKKLMENFGKDLGDKEPKEAIGILETIYESLGLRNIQELLYDSKNLCSEWKSTNREDLFDKVFNSAYSTAKQKNNEDLLMYLETYKECITNHDKARELYERVDPNKEYLIMVIDKIHNAHINYTLKGLMEELGARFAHNDHEEAVSILEATHEALNAEKDFIEQIKDNELSIDALFSEAFYSMYEIAERCSNQDLLKALEECYLTGESVDIV